MGKLKNIHSFFKRKRVDEVENTTCNSPSTQTHHELQAIDPPQGPQPQFDRVVEENHPSKFQRIELEEVPIPEQLERDPGLRLQIWEHPVNQRDEIRRAYLNMGPHQVHLAEYPWDDSEKHPRRFSATWFKLFPSWLEYSEKEDAAYCFRCFLFCKKPSGRPGSNAFTQKGFKNWKKVNSGKTCALRIHVGDSPCSPHNNAVRYCEDLLNYPQHIRSVIDVQTSEEVLKGRLRLKTSIDAILWLTFQTCALRGHDETPTSKNRGNFLEMISLLASYNDQVANVVLEKAPYNSKYTSPTIQKEILHILSTNIQKYIRDEIGESKFCILVDEARDESKREQMALILRFVDKDGFIKERFFDIVHVKDTSSATLKEAICGVLSQYTLSVENIRGQGYDGASNMRGEFNGLQALFLGECEFAYYVHCFAHRLQLALVAASSEVTIIQQFFSNLAFIINIACGSSKRSDLLRDAKLVDLAQLRESDELETGKGANQIRTLKRAGDTRWGSHYYSVCNLIEMFGPTCIVLDDIAEHGSSYSQRGDADSAYKFMTSFEFVFVLHLMKEMMGITNILCQGLQQKCQDIVNATISRDNKITCSEAKR